MVLHHPHCRNNCNLFELLLSMLTPTHSFDHKPSVCGKETNFAPTTIPLLSLKWDKKSIHGVYFLPADIQLHDGMTVQPL